MAEVEKWKPLGWGYGNWYEVSNRGRVMSLRTGKILIAHDNGFGYLVVSPSVDTRRKTIKIHKAVALAFLCPPTEDRLQVNHINGLRHDNRAENLEYVSALDNVAHSVENGLRSGKYLSKRDLLKIRLMTREGKTVGQISKTLGIRWKNVYRAATGRTYALVF